MNKKLIYIAVILSVVFSQYSIGQSHIQRASMTHERMQQQMNHNFHMMTLNMANNSARSVKKNVKYLNKRIKQNNKTVTKYDEKLLKLQQKLQASNVADTKKQKRLKKRIGIYQEVIEAINKETSELEPLLKKQKEFIAKKKAEKQAKKNKK